MTSIRVLVADDQPLVRRGITLLLREEDDLEVVGEAGDGLQAVDSARRLRPDVVLMDIDMPSLSGLEATRQIVETVDDVAVLILTVYDRADFLFQALQAGAMGFVLKTACVEELIGLHSDSKVRRGIHLPADGHQARRRLRQENADAPR